MTDLPIACALSPAELRDGEAPLLPGLARSATRREALPDGLRLTFDADPGIVARVADVIERERRCCRFLAFAVHVPPDGASVRLDVTGPPGTTEFLGGLLTHRQPDSQSIGR